MKKFLLLFCLFPLFATSQNRSLDQIAEQYIRLGLDIGRYDADFVDAYYGPENLQPLAAKKEVFPKDSFIREAKGLQKALKPFSRSSAEAEARQRAVWMQAQLQAAIRRIRVFSGEFSSFDKEAKELFGVKVPKYPQQNFDRLLAELDGLLPAGSGTIQERYQALAAKFTVPKDQVDALLRATIAESARRTSGFIPLPAGENFQLE